MENHGENGVIEIDLLEMINILFRRIWIILGAGVGAAVIGFVISSFVLTPNYESTTIKYSPF